jgi:predicted AlkP superfamily phosphohydrolase/phosphomutase
MQRNFFSVSLALLMGLAIVLPLAHTPLAGAAEKPRVIVLGFDGADPDVCQRMMDEGRLPNLKKLADSGSFSGLATTNPAESPVSWASFATSQGPGYHGIFDFLRRTPGTYLPEIALASASTQPMLPNKVLRVAIGIGIGVALSLLIAALLLLTRRTRRVAWIAAAVFAFVGASGASYAVLQWVPYELPLPVLNREGIPFWDRVAAQGLRVTAIDIPVTFPAVAEDGVQLTTALGTPDIRQTWGNWSLYSSQSFETDFSETAGNLKHVVMNGDTGHSTVRGPKNFLAEGEPEVDLPISFTRIDDTTMQIELGGRTMALKVGEWSDFVTLRFPMNPLVKLIGTTRLKLLDMSPDWHVYFEPLNFHPDHLPPTVNISSPRDYAALLADRYGLRETLGWSITTNALKDDAIDYGTFVEDLEFTLANRKKVVFGEMARNDWDLFTAVFMFTDRMQHMMYRAIDKTHPNYSVALNAEFGGKIDWAYEEMDRLVGKTMAEHVDDNTVLMVVSDHGFHSFRRGVNLNTWLVKNGFMTLKGMGLADEEGNYQRLEDFLDPDGRFFQNVDWSRTKAYCLGLGSMYINLRGRERQGTVNPSDYDRVRQEIRDGLLALEDPEHVGQPVVVDVFMREDIFDGPKLPVAPDLFVGFESGYRVSWQTAAGGIPPQILEDNMNNWSGDHCSVSPDLTAGIFFTNQQWPEKHRSIMDIGPTVMQSLDLSLPGPNEISGIPLQNSRGAGR